MKQSRFEALHQSDWSMFEEAMTALEKRKPCALNDFPAAYRQLCHQLSLAKSRAYNPQLIQYLNQLVMRGHQQLYQSRQSFWASLWYQLAVGFPLAVRQNASFMWIGTALFWLPLLLIFALIQFHPETVYVLIAPENVAEMEAMYSPSAEHIGRNRDADSDVEMFGFYIFNNIRIAFQTFASGLFFGIGSIFFLVFNGLHIGAVFAHLYGIGYHAIFSFAVAHGSFELTAICLSGGTGLKLGWALLSPKQLTRQAALVQAGRESVPLMIGCGIFLLIAAFIEAFWSSNGGLPLSIRYSVGGILWLSVLAWLFLAGRQDAAQDGEL